MSHTISPAEKILVLAQSLPATQSELYQEGLKTERLLQGLAPAETEMGAELTQYLADILEAQLDGIQGLLEYNVSGDEGLLAECLTLIMESAQGLTELEELVEEAREDVPLVA